MNRLRYLIGCLLCSLFRHPPNTWGRRGMEDPLLRMLAKPAVPGHRLTITVSCMCHRRMVPFRAQPLTRQDGSRGWSGSSVPRRSASDPGRTTSHHHPEDQR